MSSPVQFELTALDRAVVHRVGNRHNDEALLISKGEIPVHSNTLGAGLRTYFLKGFSAPEFYHFTFTNGDPGLNPLMQFCADIFNDPARLLINSVHIAKHLYELTNHPNIKPGDLFVAYFRNVVYGGKSCEAVGIFKAESKQSFLKIDEESGGLEVKLTAGIQIDKLDKGCIVVNTDKNDGYRVMAVDRTNRGQEAHYWMDDFLRIAPVVDSYYRTREVMHETRQFVVEEAVRQAPMDKASQIDLLNKSAAYFRENEQFDGREFEETVFREAGLVDAYRNFVKTNRNENEGMATAPETSFDISSPAVKKFGKVYKSVLKLDKNFHVYIHGDRNLIVRGREADGRKYYKIYYEEES